MIEYDKKFGCYSIHTPYNQAFISFLRTVNPIYKHWSKEDNVWYIDKKVIDTVTKQINNIYGANEKVPPLGPTPNPVELTEEIMYIGNTRERADQTVSAYGLVGSEWKLVFPEEVLRFYFTHSTVKKQKLDYFGLYGITAKTTDQELASTYRRLARQWHPDVCKEPNAMEMMTMINEGYEVLKDPLARKRYIAGLKFSEQISTTALQIQTGKATRNMSGAEIYFNAIYKCGKVTFEAQPYMGVYNVLNIKEWLDIIRGNQVMVSSWVFGDDRPTINWVNL